MSHPPWSTLDVLARDVLLGQYEFDRFRVHLTLHDDDDARAVSFSHEHAHLKLGDTTTFGILMKHVERERAGAPGPPSRDRLGGALAELLQRCSLVQEMYATYSSIVEHQREDLLASYPKEYRDCFLRMQRLVERLFPTYLLRLLGSYCVARLCMLTPANEFWNRASELSVEFIQEHSEIIGVPNDRMLALEALTIDLDAMYASIERFGQAELFRAFMSHERIPDAMAALGESLSTTPNAINALGAQMMYGMFAHLEVDFPGLENARQSASIMRLASLVSGPAVRSVEDELALSMCHQVVSAVGDVRMRTSVRDLDPIGIMHFVHLQRGIAYTLLMPGVGDQVLEAHITEFDSQVAHGVVHYRTTDLERVAGVARQVPHFAIAYVPNVRDVPRMSSFLARMPSSFMVGHVPWNPIEFLERTLAAGHQVEWASLSIGFDSGPIAMNRGLELCIYWVEPDHSFPWFHLSNAFMTAGVRLYQARHQTSASILELDSAELVRRFPLSVARDFLGHPALSYLLTGSTLGAWQQQ